MSTMPKEYFERRRRKEGKKQQAPKGIRYIKIGVTPCTYERIKELACKDKKTVSLWAGEILLKLVGDIRGPVLIDPYEIRIAVLEARNEQLRMMLTETQNIK